MFKTKKLPSQKFLHEHFNYDPFTGILTLKKSWTLFGSIRVGDVVGTKTSCGYLRVTINKQQYKLHRIIYKWMTNKEPEAIDHINGIGTDNRWSNIRGCKQSQNMLNRKRDSRNKSGFKGVTKHGSGFRATIGKNKQTFHLGVFDTAEEAHAAYCKKAEEFFGEFHSDGK